MSKILAEKLALQDVVRVFGVAEDMGDHYIVDTLPCLANPVFRVEKIHVTVTLTAQKIQCPDGKDVSISEIRIKRGSPILMLVPITASEQSMLVASSGGDCNAQSAGEIVPHNAANIDQLRGMSIDFKCLPWIAHPLYLQAVAALEIAKRTGAIPNKSRCMEIANSAAELGRILGPLGPTIVGSCAECACKKVF